MSGLGAGASRAERVQFGLRANVRQFWLLVLITAFTGAMVGLERTVLPILAEREFGLASKSAILSFLVTFGLVKAIVNLLAGGWGDRVGRKRVLVAGWLAGLPVPILIILAPSWPWIVAANVLLGVNQGLAWSAAVVMKIDLAGPKQRGLAMGLNEFAGYVAVAFSALLSAEIATRSGLRPEPFYLGLGYAALGLALSQLVVRDTLAHATAERQGRHRDNEIRLGELVRRVTWSDPTLSSASHAGLVNNLNDGVAWGLFPLFFAAAGLSLREIGVLGFVYPATWGLLQIWTGALSDRVGRKPLIVGGMLLQGCALLTMAITRGFPAWLGAAVLLGVGTAMVYPTLLATISDGAAARWRGTAVGFYRFWRDLGYAVGALMAGLLADRFGMRVAILSVGVLTLGTGLAAQIRMRESRPS